MSKYIVGIVGEAPTTKKGIDKCLGDMKDAADSDNESFWGIIGVTADAPEAIQFIFDWFIENEVAFDIVIQPAVADQLPEEYTGGADRIVKVKNVAAKVTELLAESGGLTLLGLLGGDGEASDEIFAAVQDFHDIEGNQVLALDDGLRPVELGADMQDATAPTEESEVDYDALGEAADGGDADAVATLTELGEAAGLDVNDYAEASWAEFATAIVEAAPKAAKGATKKAAAKKTDTSSSKWTEEALDAKGIKDLRTIATASGVANAGKLGFDDLKKALLGKPLAAEAPAEEEQPAEDAKPKRAPRGSKAAAPVESNDEIVGDTVKAVLEGLIAVLTNALSAL